MFDFKTIKDIQINEQQINKVCFADNMFTRLRGLLFTPEEELTGMFLADCNSVHTIGMRYSIDIIFLNRSNTIVKIIKDAQPYRLFFGTNETTHTLELGSGMTDKMEIELGQKIVIN